MPFFKTDSLGLELNSQTIFSGDDSFQKYLKAHLNRGAKMLHSEFKYSDIFLLVLLYDPVGYDILLYQSSEFMTLCEGKAVSPHNNLHIARAGVEYQPL